MLGNDWNLPGLPGNSDTTRPVGTLVPSICNRELGVPRIGTSCPHSGGAIYMVDEDRPADIYPPEPKGPTTNPTRNRQLYWARRPSKRTGAERLGIDRETPNVLGPATDNRVVTSAGPKRQISGIATPPRTENKIPLGIAYNESSSEGSRGAESLPRTTAAVESTLKAPLWKMDTETTGRGETSARLRDEGPLDSSLESMSSKMPLGRSNDIASETEPYVAG